MENGANLTNGTGNNGYVVPSRNYRILVVDDEKPICDLLGALIPILGNSFFEGKLSSKSIYASPKCEAEQIVSQNPETDILITDIRMPGNNGVELYRAFVSLPKKTMGVVFTSGYTGEIEIPKGAIFLAKPYTSQNIVDALNKEIMRLQGLEAVINQ